MGSGVGCLIEVGVVGAYAIVCDGRAASATES